MKVGDRVRLFITNSPDAARVPDDWYLRPGVITSINGETCTIKWEPGWPKSEEFSWCPCGFDGGFSEDYGWRMDRFIK